MLSGFGVQKAIPLSRFKIGLLPVQKLNIKQQTLPDKGFLVILSIS